MGEYLRWQEGQGAWEAEDGTIVYSASSLGNCIAELVWSRRGIEGMAPPDQIAQAFQDGKREEKKIIDAVQKELGVGVSYGLGDDEQHQGLIRINSSVVIQWHIDAIEIGGGRPIEVKLLADSTLRDIKAGRGYLFESYMDQITAYSFAHDKKDVLLGLGVKDKEGNFKKLDDILECTWDDDFAGRWPKIKKKIFDVEKMVRDGVEPQCMTPDRFPCSFLFMRGDVKEEKRKKDAEERVQLNNRALIEATEEYVVALDREKTFKASKEAAAALLHTLVDEEAGPDNTQTRKFFTPNGWKLSEVPVPDQTNWEKVWEFVESQGKTKDDFKVASGKTYFRITIEKGVGGEDEGDG